MANAMSNESRLSNLRLRLDDDDGDDGESSGDAEGEFEAAVGNRNDGSVSVDGNEVCNEEEGTDDDELGLTALAAVLVLDGRAVALPKSSSWSSGSSCALMNWRTIS